MATLLRMCLLVRHTIEALRAGQSCPEIWTVIFFASSRGIKTVSGIKATLLSSALLLSVLAGGTQVVLGQAAAPAPVTATAAPAVVSQTAIDAKLKDDAAVDQMLEAYSPKVRALDQPIGKLIGDLKKGGLGAGPLGNFVTDGIRAESSAKLGKPILLAVTNNGGLRKSIIPEGKVTYRDVFELLPFENALVAFDLTGAQVLDLLRVVTSHRDAQSGMRIQYRVNSDKQLELESAKFVVDGVEKEIDPAAVYTVISIDYLLNVTGSDYATVLKKATNTRPLGLTIRDAITEYIKAETAAGRDIKSTLDGRFVFDKAASGGAEEPK
jgi:2',3'-cyclic-nucleotide 2'-phosphodiesterase (5'-nucleotidase family)